MSTSPLIFRQPQPERDGMLMVGDAAGFVDPFVGDGISLALRGGALAAHCLGSFFSGKASSARRRAAMAEPTSNRCCRCFALHRRSAACLSCPARSANRCFSFSNALPRLPNTWCAGPAEGCGRERPRSCRVIKNERSSAAVPAAVGGASASPLLRARRLDSRQDAGATKPEGCLSPSSLG